MKRKLFASFVLALLLLGDIARAQKEHYCEHPKTTGKGGIFIELGAESCGLEAGTQTSRAACGRRWRRKHPPRRPLRKRLTLRPRRAISLTIPKNGRGACGQRRPVAASARELEQHSLGVPGSWSGFDRPFIRRSPWLIRCATFNNRRTTELLTESRGTTDWGILASRPTRRNFRRATQRLPGPPRNLSGPPREPHRGTEVAIQWTATFPIPNVTGT